MRREKRVQQARFRKDIQNCGILDVKSQRFHAVPLSQAHAGTRSVRTLGPRMSGAKVSQITTFVELECSLVKARGMILTKPRSKRMTRLLHIACKRYAIGSILSPRSVHKRACIRLPAQRTPTFVPCDSNLLFNERSWGI
jgi:hypothetical protein